MPIPMQASYVGVGLETSKLTAVPPTVFLPVTKFDPADNVTWLDDVGWRGSNVDIYDAVDGVRSSSLALSGDVLPDTFGFLLASMLPDVTVTGNTTATTLAAAATVGATTISSTASVAVGTVIQIDTLASGAAEVRTVTNVSGAGPYTLTVAALTYAHSNGAAVQPAYSHAMSVKNSGDLQAKGVTFTDYDGVDYRQYAGGTVSDLTIKFGADAELSYDATVVAGPSSTTTAPSRSYTGVRKMAGWRGSISLGGSADARVISGEVDLKRPATPLYTAAGSATPYSIWGGAMSAAGKLTVLAETSQLEYLAFQARNSIAASLSFLAPNATAPTGVIFQMSQIRYRTAQINRGQDHVQFDLAFTAEGNATDVGSSAGYGNVKGTVVCASASGTFQ